MNGERQTTIIERLLLTSKETAKALGICERSLYALTKAGELRAVKIGRAVRFSVDDLKAWIKKSSENS